MIGVVVPAHNEAGVIADCLASIAEAARCPALAGMPVETVVVLDRCTDRTSAIAASFDVTVQRLDAGNVGLARAAGTASVIARGARWVACTDADTRVPPTWLSDQLALDCDAFCGMVGVDDWLDYAPGVRERFEALHPRVWNHPHVHGANLGFSAAFYLACGGFAPLRAHEDVALVDAMARAGARIARAPSPLVTTSARRRARTRDGFSDYLDALERRLAAAPAAARTHAPLPVPATLGTDAHAT